MLRRACVMWGGLALAGSAFGTPQESVTYTGVDSNGSDGAAVNVVRTASFTGTYRVRSVRVQGSLTKDHGLTYASDARVRVTDPFAATYVLQPFSTTNFDGTISVPAGTQLNVGTTAASAAGAWTFRFFESYDDGQDNLADSTWSTITLTLDSDYAAPAPPAGNEVAAFTVVNSDGVLDGAGNSVRTASFAGTYTTNRLRLTGLVIAGTAPGNQAGQARLGVTPPASARVLWQPTSSTATGLVPVSGPAQLNLAAPVATAGTWTFRFYESTDEGVAVDNVWDQVSIATVATPLPPPAAQYSEVEPNDSKGVAVPVNPANDGVLVVGTSTSSAFGPSPANPDYWRIKTPPRALGMYKHVLTLRTNGDPGHTGSIRGLTQSGHAVTTTEGIVQDSAVVGADRVNQWYGFGKQEEWYYRVSGTGATTEPYYATLATTPVTPTVLPTLHSGGVTIETVGETGLAQTDTELFLYDANLSTLDLNDDEPVPGSSLGSSITRTFSAGTYYLGVGAFNTTNNLACPATDSSTSGTVMDFPNSLVRGSGGAGLNAGFRIAGGAFNQAFAVTLAGEFDIAWFRLTVTGACHGACVADVDDGTGTGIPDGGVTIDDLLYYLRIFDLGLLCADVDNGTGTGTPDGGVTIDDLLYYLFRFDSGC